MAWRGGFAGGAPMSTRAPVPARERLVPHGVGARSSRRVIGRRASRWATVLLVLAGLAMLSSPHESRAQDPFRAALAAVEAGDYLLAAELFRGLAESGDPRGQNGLGVLHLNGLGLEQDLGEALRWFEQAAEAGHLAAQNYLAQMYEHGVGVEQDHVEAASWYRRAAEAGDSDSQSSLGLMYLNGLGVEADPEQARLWLRRSAEQGNAQAQAFMGDLYRIGEGVPRDYVVAFAWYGVSAAGGYEAGPQLRDQVARFLSEEEISAGRALARQLHQRHGSEWPVGSGR
jgi:uncharacterized protein